jgi:DNA-binding SARP family transcriptional activator
MLVVTARAGYDKAVLTRRCATGRLVWCDPADAGTRGDVAGAVLDALVAADAQTAVRIAVDRLAGARTSGTTREALRRLWQRAGEVMTFVFDDWSGQLATPDGAELFAELVASAPPDRMLVTLTRAPLPAALQHVLHDIDTVTFDDEALQLSEADMNAEAAAFGVGTSDAAAVWSVAHGWPLVTRLLLRECQRAGVVTALAGADAVEPSAMLSFALHRGLAALSSTVRDAFAAVTVQRAVAYVDLVRVLGECCDDAVWSSLLELPFLHRTGDRVRAHRAARAVLRERFDTVHRRAYEATLRALIGDGRYADGARVALDADDVDRAAATIDAAPPYTSSPVPLTEYVRVIERIDRSLVTRFPNLWIATIPYRGFSVDADSYAREAETVYFCLPARAPADQRAAVLTILASAYVNVGRLAEAEALIAEGLSGFASDPSSARATILNFAASLRGIEGRFAQARALAAEAAQVSHDAFGENQTLHYIEAHEAAYRGNFHRVAVIIDELLRRQQTEALPLYRAYAAMNGAVFAWVAGDDDAFERYEAIFENALTPAIELGLAPLIDGARGRPVRVSPEYAWPLVVAGAYLYRLGHAVSADEALEAARAAAAAADRRGEPYFRMLANVALFELGETSERDRARQVVTDVAARVESDELRRAVAGVVEGGDLGMLTAYVTRRVRRERIRREPRVVVELLAGRVTRDGEEIPFSDKEFELLTLLASSPTVVTRDRIGESLWDHLDPEEWPNNLKVTLYRIRTRLGRRDAVVADGGRHRLAPTIEIDLRQAEMLVRTRQTTLDDAMRDELRSIVDAHRKGSSARYERYGWAHPLLSRITDVVGTAASVLANDALARGAIAESLVFAGYAIGIDPLDERACEAAIRAHLAGGERDAARRELGRYAAQLRRELNAEPSPHLAHLVRT